MAFLLVNFMKSNSKSESIAWNCWRKNDLSQFRSVPRKLPLLGICKNAVLVLTDELNTSRKCRACHSKCTNKNTDAICGNLGCPFLDVKLRRDESATENILRIGIYQSLGQDSPKEFQTPDRNQWWNSPDLPKIKGFLRRWQERILQEKAAADGTIFFDCLWIFYCK